MQGGWQHSSEYLKLSLHNPQDELLLYNCCDSEELPACKEHMFEAISVVVNTDLLISFYCHLSPSFKINYLLNVYFNG